MKKTLIAATASCGLFIAGIYSLLSLKDSAPCARMVVDNEPYCDDSTYLETGSTEIINPVENAIVDDEPLVRTVKPYGPEENFFLFSDGQTLHSLLRPQGISDQEIAQISLTLAPYLKAKDLAQGDQIRLDLETIDSGTKSVVNLAIRKLDQNRIPNVYRLTKNKPNSSSMFAISIKAPPVSEKIEVVRITVGSTLYQSFNQLPFGTDLMQRLMGVFAWQMKMPKEVLPGDEIEILVVKKYIYDDLVGFGQIESAVYRQKTRTLTAIYFRSSDKKVRGYFDENGKSLEREFAVSPVKETTATSNQKLRFHPVRKIRLRHNGIDFRGAVGTPFYSIADGEVIEKRYDRNVGNMIRVLHKYGVHSEYFHADSLAENINVGQRVKRGQFLGTIGRTGRLCTGPHLHMGLYTAQGEKKTFIDLLSLRNKLKPAPDVAGGYLTEFRTHKVAMLAQLSDHLAREIASIGDGH